MGVIKNSINFICTDNYIFNAEFYLFVYKALNEI